MKHETKRWDGWIRRYVVVIAGLVVCCQADSAPVSGKKVSLGMSMVDGPKYNAEFQQFGRMKPVYQESNIEATLTELAPFMDGKAAGEDVYKSMKPYHVVALHTSSEGLMTMTPEQRTNAKVVGAALARYVSEGGGLLVFPQGRRYPNADDVNYWNMVLEPLGMKVIYENVYDATRSFEATTLAKEQFWFAEDIRPHPITAGVERVCLSQNGSGPYPGVPALEYSKDWQIVVSGGKEAKSFKSLADNTVDYKQVGRYGSAAPVVAVRSLGKGRVVSLPVCFLHTGLNYGNPRWPGIVEAKGNEAKNKPSQTMKLMMNSYRWLAEPVLDNAEFGTHVNPPYKPVEFPKSVNWDHLEFDKPAGGDADFVYPDGQKPVLFSPTNGIRGIVGAHTAYTDGKGTVADYVKAAKAAGLAFVVFADPLEKLTPETLGKLKTDCASVSAGKDFYACPGIEFSDGIGNRWVAWGSKIVYPPKSFKEGDKEYVVWNGTKVPAWGHYRMLCMNSGCGLLDYRQLRTNKADPQNQWWFYHYFPFVYEKGKLIADNFAEYLSGLRDMRWAAVMSFTRITDPSEVASSARTCSTGFRDLDHARAALDSSCATTSLAWEGLQQVTQGPEITMWTAINSQLEDHWGKTRGAQRVRCHFIVRSESGIKDVKVHDANWGVIRRFAGNGAKELSKDFELVHDKQHWLALEVTDTAGKRAVSHNLMVYSYKMGMFRCGDNLNTLCGAGLVWHPDRNQGVPWINAAASMGEFDFLGYDGGGFAPALYGSAGGGPFADNGLFIKDPKMSCYPGGTGSMLGRNYDIKLGSYNMQIITEHVNRLTERFCTDTRPSPAMGRITRAVGPLEYYQATHTLYNLSTRWDAYVAWNYRRTKEGMKDYRGCLSWNEGEIKFLKDVTLRDPALAMGSLGSPFNLGVLGASDPDQRIGYMAIVKDADRDVRVAVLQRPEQPVKMEGRIMGGGYAALMPSLSGYPALLVPQGNEYRYSVNLPNGGPWRGIELYLGRDGQEIKAGTTLKFSICSAVFADTNAGPDLLEHTVSTLNLGGGTKGYPCQMKVGKLVDAVFFFTVEAERNEATFAIGPKELIVDLPFRIRGLEDNGCVAVYSSNRQWFRFVPVCEGVAYFQEPIDQVNDIWVGNVFVARDKGLKLTLVRDGQAEGKNPFLEVHNPGEKDVETEVISPRNTPQYGGFKRAVKVPAGDSIRVELDR